MSRQSFRLKVASFSESSRTLEPATFNFQPATSFPPMWLSSDSSSFVNCRTHCPTRVRVSPLAPFRIRGEIIIILRFERRVCRWESCRMHQFTGMWLNPNSRGSRLRIWQPWGCKSLHAHQFTAPGLRGNSRPQRLKIAEPSGCKSRGADRRVVNRE